MPKPLWYNPIVGLWVGGDGVVRVPNDADGLCVGVWVSTHCWRLIQTLVGHANPKGMLKPKGMVVGWPIGHMQYHHGTAMCPLG